MRRLMVAPLSILFLAVGVYAAMLNFTFTVTSASVTTSGTAMSVLVRAGSRETEQRPAGKQGARKP